MRLETWISYQKEKEKEKKNENSKIKLFAFIPSNRLIKQ